MKKIEKITRSFLTYVLFLFFYLLYLWIFKLANKIKVIGRKNLPRKTFGVLSLSNHESYPDSLPMRAFRMDDLLDVIINQKLIPYDAPDFKNFYSKKIKAFFIGLLKNFPAKRNLKDQTVKDEFVEKCCEVLKNDPLHLYFEGGRTVDEIRPCVSGVAKTILKLLEEKFDLIVIPIYINGMKNIMPRKYEQKYWKIFFRFGHKVLIVVGKQIDFSDIISLNVSNERKINLIKTRVRDSVLALKTQHPNCE